MQISRELCITVIMNVCFVCKFSVAWSHMYVIFIQIFLIFTCRCECGGFLEMPISMYYSKVFRCPLCAKERCRVCLCAWDARHWGRRCEMLVAERRANRQRQMDDRKTEALLRRCRKCSVPILKLFGCNNVHCKCGSALCYCCNDNINGIGYNHFCHW